MDKWPKPLKTAKISSLDAKTYIRKFERGISLRGEVHLGVQNVREQFGYSKQYQNHFLTDKLYNY